MLALNVERRSLSRVHNVEAESEDHILSVLALQFQLKLLQGKIQDVRLRNEFQRRELMVQLPRKPGKQLSLNGR
jgi:hypothetical protein